MKIIVVGGTGTIGKSVVAAFEKKHEVVVVSPSSKVSVDMSSLDSIRAMYQQIEAFDALIVTAGKVAFKPLAEMSAEDFQLGLHNKLMGQVQLVTEGCKHITAGGSFTLTSGILNRQPILGSSSAAMVNAALEGFVTAASLELKNGVRLNLVSPTVITEALDVYADFFTGFESVDAAVVAQAYVKSVAGIHNGYIYNIGH